MINSRDYWEDRFTGDWEAHGGPEQSRVFMDLLVHYLPAALYEEIAASELSLLDCGCAEGDGTAVLRQRFPRSAVAGCDWSEAAIAAARERYPDIEFFAADLTALERTADVLVSSNCFEHLERPLSALSRLLARARRYLLLLVPFYEGYPPHPEHVRVVHSGTFPGQLDGWEVGHRVVIPPSAAWAGEQLLLVYAPIPPVPPPSPAPPTPEEVALEALSREAAALRAALAASGEIAALRADALAAAERDRLWRERGLTELQRELERGQIAAADREGELRRLGEEHARLTAAHRELAARAAVLDGSLAVGLVLRAWRLVDRLLPAGTRRRGLLQATLRAARRPLGPPRPAAAFAVAPEATAISPAAAPTFPQPDPGEELQRFAELVARTGAETVVALFSGTPLCENEGQRPTQLALELSRRGIPVVFVYWRWSRKERCPQDRLARRILQLPIDAVVEAPGALAGAFPGCRRIALFEFPYPGFFHPLAALNGAGWLTAYDVLDDWEEFHRAGQAIWYEEEFERHLAAAADAVFAVTPLLAERLQGLGAERVELVPNGLRPGLEVVGEPRAVERGTVTVGYFGHLTEAWFDWGLVIAAARLRPAWRFHLIGYGHAPERAAELPENVLLAGKLPQSELAAWAAHWDVAMVPFQAGRLAAAADPIKTYEYLAMGLPVVVTGVAPPPGAEALVARAAGVDELLQQIESAAPRRHHEGEEGARRAFAMASTWAHRVDALLAALGGASPRIAAKERLFGRLS